MGQTFKGDHSMINQAKYIFKIGHTLDSKSLSVVEILRNMNATLNNLSPHKYIFVLAWKFAGNYKMKKKSHSEFPFAPRKYWTS